MSLSNAVDAIKGRLVDDVRDMWKWWSTWVYAAIGAIGSASLLIEAAPQSFQDCISSTAPRWVVAIMTGLALIGPLVRIVRQKVKNDPAA